MMTLLSIPNSETTPLLLDIMDLGVMLPVPVDSIYCGGYCGSKFDRLYTRGNLIRGRMDSILLLSLVRGDSKYFRYLSKLDMERMELESMSNGIVLGFKYVNSVDS